ncbi:unnamed protein product [Acanthoscelides obtectus]|uniref:Ig-like domain-containing protein n=1 Tax=Acanthoscelides obtectus TaxID=200917 RepID=A0A9P0QBF3_ACAOB|nr:unnamed protein product [Acanthoscelides obtectus]CAK1659232.1 Neurotrimin [Acanthoscelides obtectus]
MKYCNVPERRGSNDICSFFAIIFFQAKLQNDDTEQFSSSFSVPPHIIDTESTQFTVAVRENQNISLTCKADGFPIPKIIWRREDGQAINVERQKKVSPMIYVPNQLVGAPLGTDVTVHCHAEANPRAISYWMYNGVMLLPSKKYATEMIENSYRTHMKLTVRDLQEADFGNYRCISKNSLGETEGSIRLYGNVFSEVRFIFV